MRFILLLVLILLQQTAFSANQCSDLFAFPNVAALKSGNALSTYVFDYWDYGKRNITQEVKKIFSKDDMTLLLTEGLIAGDYHFNNVALYFNESKSKPELALADLDDVGRGSYFLDLVKFFTFLKDEKIDFKKKKLIKSYIAGLNSASVDYFMTDDFKSSVQLPHLEFEKQNAKFVENKIVLDYKNRASFTTDLELNKNIDAETIKFLKNNLNQFFKGYELHDLCFLKYGL